MNKSAFYKLTSCYFFLSLIPFSLSFAQQHISTPGAAIQAASSEIFKESDVINVSFDLNRSYSCTLQGLSSESLLGLDESVINPKEAKIVGTLNGDQTPTVTAGEKDTSQADNRISVFSTVRGVWKFRVSSSKLEGEEGVFFCQETSLYGNWNTFSNPFNFLELSNLTNKSLEVIIILKDFKGESFSSSLTLSPERRKDVDIHSIVGDKNYGSLKIKHSGPVGALSGTLSEYSVDSSLKAEIRNSSKLERRDF